MTDFGFWGCPFDQGKHQFYEMIFKDINDPYSGVRGKDLDYCKKCGMKKEDKS